MKSAETILYWRDDDLPGLEVRLARATAHSFPYHSHDTYAIGVMEGGACRCLENGDDRSLIVAGQLALLNPCQVHTGNPVAGGRVSYRMFYIQPRWVCRAAAELRDGDDRLPELTRLVADAPEVRRLFQRLGRAVAVETDRLGKESSMVEAVSLLLRRFAAPAPGPVHSGGEHRAVRLAREFLCDNMAAKVTLDELAAVAGLSRYHLLRVFKRETGLPPHVYQLQQRVDRAKARLTAGQPIAQVALEAGFVDQSHFTNTFRRFVGATPRQYQQD